MDGSARWWVVVVGVVGLAAVAGGSPLMPLPRIDATHDEVVATLVRRPSALLAGAALSVLGVGLLLWPLAATSAGDDGWGGLAPFALATWVLGFSFLAVGAVVPAAVAWRDPAGLPA